MSGNVQLCLAFSVGFNRTAEIFVHGHLGFWTPASPIVSRPVSTWDPNMQHPGLSSPGQFWTHIQYTNFRCTFETHKCKGDFSPLDSSRKEPASGGPKNYWDKPTQLLSRPPITLLPHLAKMVRQRNKLGFLFVQEKPFFFPQWTWREEIGHTACCLSLRFYESKERQSYLNEKKFTCLSSGSRNLILNQTKKYQCPQASLNPF